MLFRVIVVLEVIEVIEVIHHLYIGHDHLCIIVGVRRFFLLFFVVADSIRLRAAHRPLSSPDFEFFTGGLLTGEPVLGGLQCTASLSQDSAWVFSCFWRRGGAYSIRVRGLTLW